MKNKRLVSSTSKEIIISIIVSLAVFIITVIITLNGWFPHFDGNKILKLTYYGIIAFLLIASALTSIVTITVFITGVIGNFIINKEHKKNATISSLILSNKYSSVKLDKISDLNYLVNKEDIECCAKLNDDGTINVKIKLDANIALAPTTFINTFDVFC